MRHREDDFDRAERLIHDRLDKLIRDIFAKCPRVAMDTMCIMIVREVVGQFVDDPNIPVALAEQLIADLDDTEAREAVATGRELQEMRREVRERRREQLKRRHLRVIK